MGLEVGNCAHGSCCAWVALDSLDRHWSGIFFFLAQKVYKTLVGTFSETEGSFQIGQAFAC